MQRDRLLGEVGAPASGADVVTDGLRRARTRAGGMGWSSTVDVSERPRPAALRKLAARRRIPESTARV